MCTVVANRGEKAKERPPGAHQNVRSRGCRRASDAEARPAPGPVCTAAAAPGTLRGFLQPYTVTCPGAQQQEHGFTRGLVREWLWQPYSQPQIRNNPDPPVQRKADT